MIVNEEGRKIIVHSVDWWDFNDVKKGNGFIYLFIYFIIFLCVFIFGFVFVSM